MMKKEQLKKFFEQYDVHRTLKQYVEYQANVNTSVETEEELENTLLDVQYKEVKKSTIGDFVWYHVVDKKTGIYQLINADMSQVKEFIREL